MTAEAPMPKRPYRTPEQLREASKHLAYEVWMFESTCHELEAGGQPDAVRCALLESFAIHTRILLDVFFPPKIVKVTDVLAVDFFTDGSAWSETHKASSIDAALVNAHTRTNKEIVHLTYDRTTKEPESWDWNVTLMRNAMRLIVMEFARAVPYERLDEPAWRRWRSPELRSATQSAPSTPPTDTSRETVATTTVNSITVAPLVSMPPSQKEE
jgi:hypothetical protein